MANTTTALENAQSQLAEVAKILNLEPCVHDFLKEPMRQLIVRFPVKMDDGSVRVFQGFRFQHNWSTGPIRGGTRFHKDETADDVKALAMWMTIKNTCNNIPNGGGKGGIAVDPATLSKGELERVCRAYMRAIAPICGGWNDFPGADIGTDNQTQSWMLDEWEAMNLRLEPSAISGKAMVLGGSEGRAEATSRGLLFATREVAKVLGRDIKGLTAAVQGFGKVGWNLAKLYEQDGVKVIAVSDVKGGILNRDGLNILDVYAHFERTGTVLGYPNAQEISNAEILELECDVLAPCAVQNVITEENAAKVKARMLIEGANGPTTAAAEKILLQNGVFISPDVFSNSGGTQVAHFERIQNLSNDHWTEEAVNAKLEALISQVFKEIYAIHKEKQITMRMACWVKAVKIVVEAMKFRGWI